jgi:hypothetical protein
VTEPTTEATPEQTTPEQTTDAKPVPGEAGRARRAAVAARDEVVFQYLSQFRTADGTRYGKTRAEIIEATGLPSNEVYLSLYRLKHSDRIGNGGWCYQVLDQQAVVPTDGDPDAALQTEIDAMVEAETEVAAEAAAEVAV